MLMHLCICGCFICPLMFHQAVDGLNSQLNLMRSQSDSVHTEASDLVFQQAGKADRVLFHTFLTLWKKKTKSTLFCFADIESTVLDNKKYIEETNEMMDSSSKKIAKIISDISAIHKGKNKLYNYFFFFVLTYFPVLILNLLFGAPPSLILNSLIYNFLFIISYLQLILLLFLEINKSESKGWHLGITATLTAF